MSKQTDLINIPDAITVSGSNVGIGTSSPTSDMSVGSTTTSSGDIALRTTKTAAVITPSNSNAGGLDIDVGWVAGGQGPLTFSIGSTERMRITSTGNVGIGTSNPSKKFVVSEGGAHGFEISPYDGSQNATRLLNYNRSTNAYFPLEIEASQIAFETNGSEKMRIDSSGNLFVGKTSAGLSTAGVQLDATGSGGFCRAETCLTLSRLSTDGSILDFRKDSTTVGSIMSRGGAVSTLILDPRGNGAGLSGTTNGILPTTQTGSPANNHVDLGTSSSNFRNAYLSGGVYLGGTGSANKLDDYEEGTWTPGAKGASSGHVATVSSGTAGSYVKIGNQVSVNFIVVITSLGSATGALQITGLPFTVADILVSTGIEANGTAGYWAGFATNINNLVYTAEGNSNLLYAYGTTNGTQPSISNITIAQMGTAALRGSISYRTT